MMLNYMRSEWYRITRGHEWYVFTGVLCAIAMAMNLLLVSVGASDPHFPYATVRFSLSNLISMLSLLFFAAGLLVWNLFSDEGKNGTFKNAVAHGVSRRDLFVGKCFVSTVLGLIGLAVFLIVYIGSALLLLEGPGLEAVGYLLQGVGAALPYTIACVVLAVAVCAALPKPTTGLIAWLTVVVLIPYALGYLGMVVELAGTVAGWMPIIFFSSGVYINQSGAAEFLWNDPAGLARCLIAGFAGIALFGAVGLWRAGKTEL